MRTQTPGINSSERLDCNVDYAALNRDLELFRTKLSERPTVTDTTFTNCILSTIEGAGKLEALIEFCDQYHAEEITDDFYAHLVLFSIQQGNLNTLRVLIDKKGFDPEFATAEGYDLANRLMVITNDTTRAQIEAYLEGSLGITLTGEREEDSLEEELDDDSLGEAEGLEVTSDEETLFSFTNAESTPVDHVSIRSEEGTSPVACKLVSKDAEMIKMRDLNTLLLNLSKKPESKSYKAPRFVERESERISSAKKNTSAKKDKKPKTPSYAKPTESFAAKVEATKLLRKELAHRL